MKKLFAIAFILCFTSVSSAEIVTLSLDRSRDIPELFDHISLFEPYSFSVDALDYQIVGGVFSSHDLENMDFALNRDDLSGGMSVGFARGFSKDKLENRDAFLALYISATPGASITSPRAIPQVQFDISITDNQGDAGIFVENTLKDEFPVIGKPLYGVVLWGVYSDAVYFDIAVGGETVRIEADSLPYLTESQWKNR